MRPAKAKFKKFKMDPKYVHMRSEGLTKRQNGGTRRLVIDRASDQLTERSEFDDQDRQD